jgi:hypothetical protein
MLIVFCLLLFLTCCCEAQVIEKPMIQGYGSNAWPTTELDTVHVTNLDTDSPGCFWNAFYNKSNRYIIFDTAGVIYTRPTSSFDTKTSANIVIDGFSAPSPGITIKGRGLRFGTPHSGQPHNIVVMGISVENDSLGGESDACLTIYGEETEEPYNLAFINCSFIGGCDGNINISKGTENATFEECIISRGRRFSQHPSTDHSMGVNSKGNKISFINCLLSETADRMVSCSEGKVEVVGCLTYCWMNNNVTKLWQNVEFNAYNNTYIPCPESGIEYGVYSFRDSTARAYLRENIVEEFNIQNQWELTNEEEGSKSYPAPTFYALQESNLSEDIIYYNVNELLRSVGPRYLTEQAYFAVIAALERTGKVGHPDDY